MIINTEKQAARLVKRVFPKDQPQVSKVEVRNRMQISENTYYNYAAILKRFGLAEGVESPTDSKTLKITEKGQEAHKKPIPKTKPGPQPNRQKPQVLTPQLLQDLVNEYNTANPVLPLRLDVDAERRERYMAELKV